MDSPLTLIEYCGRCVPDTWQGEFIAWCRVNHGDEPNIQKRPFDGWQILWAAFLMERLDDKEQGDEQDLY